jgi:hypothetical protein
MRSKEKRRGRSPDEGMDDGCGEEMKMLMRLYG